MFTEQTADPGSVTVPVYEVTLEPVVRLPPFSPKTEYESQVSAVPS